MLDHIKYGIYRVDLDRFDVDSLASISFIDLLISGFPPYKEGQQMHYFKEYIRGMIEDSVCIGQQLDSVQIEKIIGPSFLIQEIYPFQETYTVAFKFNFGRPRCPTSDASIWNVFEACSSITFKIENGVLIDLTEYIRIPNEENYVD